MKRTRLVMMAGLPGTGKSTLAQRLAKELNGVVLDKDVVRAALFPEAWIEYSQEQDDFCVDMLLDAAGFLVGRPAPPPYVFLDGRTFAARYQVERVLERARQMSCRVSIILTVCSDAAAEQRVALPHVAKNRNFALYLKRKAEFEEIRQPHLTVDTDEPPEACAAQCLRYLAETI